MNEVSESAAQSASEALQDALAGLGNARLQELQQGIEEAYRDAKSLLEEQREVEEQLRVAVDLALRSRQSGARRRSS